MRMLRLPGTEQSFYVSALELRGHACDDELLSQAVGTRQSREGRRGMAAMSLHVTINLSGARLASACTLCTCSPVDRWQSTPQRTQLQRQARRRLLLIYYLIDDERLRRCAPGLAAFLKSCP
jgi:hypothetical protein